MSDTLLKYIATNATANVRQLEGILNHLKADHDLEGGDVNMDTVRRAIKDILIGTGTKPTPSLIIEEVCKYYNIKPDRIRVKNQSKDIVMPRQIACYILQQRSAPHDRHQLHQQNQDGNARQPRNRQHRQGPHQQPL